MPSGTSEFRLQDIADRVGARLVGDPGVHISGVAGLEEAGPGQITFLGNGKSRSMLGTTHASAIVVGESIPGARQNLLVVRDPEEAFLNVTELFTPERRPSQSGIHPSATVGKNVEFGQDVTVMAHVFIGDGSRIGARTVLYPGVFLGQNVRIGEDCRLYPYSVVLDDCQIGNRVILQSGAVIGSDGFSYLTRKGTHRKIPHLGTVILEDDVEVGANSTIDRGRLAATRIGRGTKIDNLVHVGHNVQMSENCLLAAQVGLAGSVRIGPGVAFGGQSGVLEHISIGERARIAGRAGVTKDVPPKLDVSGFPARPHRESMRELASLRKFPKSIAELRNLSKRIKALEKKAFHASDSEDD